MSNYLIELAKKIEMKKKENVNESYTSFLLEKGHKKCSEKFLEEVEEFKEAIANDSNIIHESADVIYHFLVTLESRGIKFTDVLKELEKRKNISGFQEKESRSK
tara:strand:+ start:300 stop:611 length:312 start_codon:yes stop_codon:yes gene_type:complete